VPGDLTKIFQGMPGKEPYPYRLKVKKEKGGFPDFTGQV
jgi:hypothetical protein